ncbi:unnamed protein product [Brassica oleracea var. botrytis]
MLKNKQGNKKVLENKQENKKVLENKQGNKKNKNFKVQLKGCILVRRGRSQNSHY